MRELKRKTLWIYTIVLGIVFIGLIYFWLKPKPTVVALVPVTRQTMENRVLATGTVKSTTRQIISSTDLTMPIHKINVTIGQQVRLGDVLITCQNAAQAAALTAAQKQVHVAQEALSQAQAQYRAAPAGFQAQFAASVSSAESSLYQAQDQLSQAQAAYDATMIRATVDGYVIMVNPQGIASDGSQAPIVEVVGQAKQIVVSVSEEDAVHLHSGMSATVTSDAFPSTTWKGDVTRVASYAVANQAGTGQVEVDLSVSGDFPVPLGYQVDVHIISATHRSVPVVPYEALVADGNQYAVFVYRANRVQKMDVTLGITGDATVEVLSGLAAGQQVVLNPPSGLVSGQVVSAS